MTESQAVTIAKLVERLEHVSENLERTEDKQNRDLDSTSKKLDSLDARLKVIEEMAVRYKGGFLTVLTIGGFIGWVSSNFDFIRSWFRGSM